ncbi:MAG TPA: hypothetical protein DC063_01580 [Arenimonas sp.]|nr:MAG: hypothetical protein A2X76_06615 [Xanthomonadales bacterium GWF1_69_6]HBD18905.1 hypothetical protein [Arenimonas sp.]
MNLPSTQPIPLLLGIPDDGMAKVGLDPARGMISVVLTGNAPFFTQVSKEVSGRLPIVYFGPGINPKATRAPRGAPLVNGITEPDLCSVALDAIAAMVDETGAHCFNPPRAVQASRRDEVSRRLAGIDGVLAPRTIRVPAIAEPAELATAIADAGLAWPVLVRVAGGHGNSPLRKVDDAAGLSAALRTLPWGGRDLYVSEYVDYRGADGLFRKLRLVVVGKDVFLRHHIAAEGWHVHAASRTSREELVERELGEIANFERDLLPQLRDRVVAIGDVLGLDYFGIDAALLPDGRLLVFEANAAMNVLHDSNPHEPRWGQLIGRIRTALVNLLFTPKLWRAARTDTSH